MKSNLKNNCYHTHKHTISIEGKAQGEIQICTNT